MFSCTEMSDDRALECRPLREVVDIRRDPMEYEPQDIGIAIEALAHQLEAALESHDVRLGLQVLGELRIEQPRRADPQTRRRLREMPREEGRRPGERVVACLRGEGSALRDVDAKGRV